MKDHLNLVSSTSHINPNNEAHERATKQIKKMKTIKQDIDLLDKKQNLLIQKRQEKQLLCDEAHDRMSQSMKKIESINNGNTIYKIFPFIVISIAIGILYWLLL